MNKLVDYILDIYQFLKLSFKISKYRLNGYRKLMTLDKYESSDVAEKIILSVNYLELTNRKSPLYSFVYSFVLFIFVASLLA